MSKGTQTRTRFAVQHAIVVIITFEEQDGQTLLTSATQFPTREDLDTTLGLEMKDGALQSLDRLGELLTTLGQGVLPNGCGAWRPPGIENAGLPDEPG